MTTPPLLVGFPFRISYGASDDRLHDFYLPALERSVRFDRATGFFSSAALTLAAAGIVRLVANDGRMRLLCGAQLSEEDVEAVRRGAVLREVVGQAMCGCLADPTDRTVRGRLEALAWMVANGRLEIRVVLPRGPDGHPLAADAAREYYHPKEGVFVDAEGNRLAFSGSSNDSENGWQWNYEVFSVYATWPIGAGEDAAPALPQFVRGVERRFERLWAGQEESWIALDIPEAARQRLLSFRPDAPPSRDPLEEEVEGPAVRPESTPKNLQRERVLFTFLREAPFLPGGERIGVETSTVRPWPHQRRVVEQLVARYPGSFLLCDEVGLGKTIEAALAVRQLVISGQVRRALLLVPKSVLRQWQEELYEKAVLNVPRYDGQVVRDVFGREVEVTGSSPWTAVPLLLASSQLAKRRERQEEVLAAEPWDLVIVDEAHHARRKDFLQERRRPNRLLELLGGAGSRPGLAQRTRCLYLMTATPMQVDAVEVWDLLKLLGLGGRWGAGQEGFLKYFRELRKPSAERDWAFLLRMVRDYLETGGSLDQGLLDKADADLGFVEARMLRDLPYSSKPLAAQAQLSSQGRAYLHELVRRHTPLRSMMWRSTRALLRTYREKGLLQEKVPTRRPENVWVELREGVGQERDLYERVDEYISSFYEKYEAERKGLGFVMTVYRRRLTSSFHALRCSLERRLAYLRGVAASVGLTDDDLELEDLEKDVTEDEELAAEGRNHFAGELVYVQDFIRALGALQTDSKLERLHEELRGVFKRRDTVLLFTQYTDTMDYLRDQLREVYGRQVACYSGRGGERWDGAAWVLCPKEEVKALFRQGEEIKILLCTESASEGLNLQTCGVLVNYDMPWNPMRVEQRIGRIDRIGQRFDEVWVRNYFYQDTVEATVYQRLGDRIEWFEQVVGELQPILQRVGRTIEQTAMLRKEERAKRLEDEIAAIRRDLDARSLGALEVDAYVDDTVVEEGVAPPPVTLQQLESALLGSQSVGPFFRAHSEIPGAHTLTWRGSTVPVTFDPDVFDRYPYTVQLMSYGSPLLDELLLAAGPPDGSDSRRGLVWLHGAGEVHVSLFARPWGEGAVEVRTLADLEHAVGSGDLVWSEAGAVAAEQLHRRASSDRVEGIRRVLLARLDSETQALREEARQLLVTAAYLDRELQQADGLFSDPVTALFGDEPVRALARHGAPFKGLLQLAAPEIPAVAPSDPAAMAIQGLAGELLRRRLEAVSARGYDALGRFSEVRRRRSATLAARPEASPTVETRWMVLDRETAEKGPESAGSLVERVVPFRRLNTGEVRPYENSIPLLPLEAAAGGLGGSLELEPESWVQPVCRTRLRRGLFVARVTGESMNRVIPNGSWCVFRHPVEGSREGKVVLVQLHDATDPEHGGRYTVKRYHGIKASDEDHGWRHTRIELRPDTDVSGFEPIVIKGTDDAEGLTVLAELVEVLGLGD